MTLPIFWHGWAADCRDAVRSLRGRPTFTLGSILLSAIALAATASGFAIVYGILWRPLPFPSPERLAVIWQMRGGEQTQVSYPDYRDLAVASVFERTAAMSGGRGSLRVGDRIERINALAIEAAGFAMLGARPHLGRLLSSADADQPVALVSYRLWATHLGSDPNIIGRPLWMSGREYTVVGVLQQGFDFELPVPPSFVLEDNDLWTVLDRSSPFLERRDVSTYEALVRLAPGRSLQEAQAALDATAAALSQRHPATNVARTFRIASLHQEIVAPVRESLIFVTLGGAVTMIVALANLLILTLVRGSERHSEFSVRAALGAGNFRIRQRLFAEHALLTACGALAGAALARAIVETLLATEAAHLPRPDAIRFDGPVLVFVAALALGMIAILAAQPLNLRSTSLVSATRAVTRSARRPRRLLVATEVALAITLTTAGAVLALSLVRLLATDTGFEPKGAAVARVSAYEAEYRTREDVVRFFDDVGSPGTELEFAL